MRGRHIPEVKKKQLTIALMAVGAFGFVLTFLIWNISAIYLPHSPDPATGRVYRLSQHDMVVYQTKQEHLIYWGVLACSMVFACIGGLLMVIDDLMPDRGEPRQ